MPNIETLRFLWWMILGVLFMGFAITDGFDLGAAALLPYVTRTEEERRTVLNAVGPFWEGNQVWIILGAGAIFAAWPYVYAVAFSGFYLLILLLLLTMGISRPVSFKYRDKLPNQFWRRFWDWIVVIGGTTPAIIFGMLIGNALQGVPFYFDHDLRMFYAGSFFALFNPFALWCGFTSLIMLMMHGGLYLIIKTHDPIRARAIYWTRWMAILFIIFFAVGGVWALHINGYIAEHIDPFGFSNPLNKAVTIQSGAWFRNYALYPWAMLAPVIGFLGAFLVLITASWWNGRLAFLFSAMSIIGVIATVGVSMFPFLLPSSSHPESSLLVWDASSSQLTLLLMLVATLIFLPIILVYTSWVYNALRGKVGVAADKKETAY